MMGNRKLSGREFITAMKPLLGITSGIISLNITADCHSVTVATVELVVNHGDVCIEDITTPDKTETRRFIFEVTEVKE